jgi:acetyl-CoA acetyltransferase
LHCCPNSDGAAAVVLCSERVAKGLPGPHVRVAASVVRSGRFSTGHRDMTWPDITERTANAAYAQSGFGPDDLDLVELHDAFAIAELLHAEALGIAECGKAHAAVATGQFDRDGRVAVSPSGGLLSRGHPVGATGVAQICEAYWQLTEQAGVLQVPGAQVALTHLFEPVPLTGEPVTPEDIAATVTFFLDRRSGYITGQVLHCCGGASLLSSLSV